MSLVAPGRATQHLLLSHRPVREMGKNWKGNKGGGGGGGKQGGGGGGDLPSVRGFACVAGTCDGAREREANRELINLLNEALDELYPLKEDVSAMSMELSVQDALQAELAAVRTQSHGATQRVRTINTGMKGFVLARITDRSVCPVRLVASIFKRVEATRLPCARNLVRIFPLQKTFYPNADELETAVAACILKEFDYTSPSLGKAEIPTEDLKRSADEASVSAEGGDAASDCEKKLKVSDGTAVTVLEATVETDDTPAPSVVNVAPERPAVAHKLVMYNLFFNRRNNDKLTKQAVLDNLWSSCPEYVRYNYKTFQGAFVMEVVKNVAGISYVPNYRDMHEFNIRKYQASFGLSIDSKGERVPKAEIRTAESSIIVSPSSGENVGDGVVAADTVGEEKDISEAIPA